MKKPKKNIKEIVEQYASNRLIYERLSTKVELLIKEILESQGILFHSVSSRTKEIASFEKKALDSKYNDPMNQIKDLCGIRIITYVESDVKRISDIIEKEFKIDPIHFNDKSNNKFGYRSIHYIATLDDIRSNLTESLIFKDKCFEIQIRTILQHAWAEIEHDRGYKLEGVTADKDDLKHRFAVISGILKMADTEFDSIVNDLNKYEEKVESDTRIGNYNIPIDSISLMEYMHSKFKDQIEYAGLRPNFGKDNNKIIEIIEELNNFGLINISQIDFIIPKDFNIKASIEFNDSNFIAILRSIMMINDIQKYFASSWNNNWGSIDYGGVHSLNAYNINYKRLFNKLDIDIDIDENDYEDIHNE